MKVAFYGPNLNKAGQDKGYMHVHRQGCGHENKYGPGKIYGGDAPLTYPWTKEVESMQEVVEEVYDEMIRESDSDWTEYECELWIAPCVRRELPRKIEEETQ